MGGGRESNPIPGFLAALSAASMWLPVDMELALGFLPTTARSEEFLLGAKGLEL